MVGKLGLMLGPMLRRPRRLRSATAHRQSAGRPVTLSENQILWPTVEVV
jgi:hypothetical protein